MPLLVRFAFDDVVRSVSEDEANQLASRLDGQGPEGATLARRIRRTISEAVLADSEKYVKDLVHSTPIRLGERDIEVAHGVLDRWLGQGRLDALRAALAGALNAPPADTTDLKQPD